MLSHSCVPSVFASLAIVHDSIDLRMLRVLAFAVLLTACLPTLVAAASELEFLGTAAAETGVAKLVSVVLDGAGNAYFGTDNGNYAHASSVCLFSYTSAGAVTRDTGACAAGHAGLPPGGDGDYGFYNIALVPGSIDFFYVPTYINFPARICRFRKSPLERQGD